MRHADGQRVAVPHRRASRSRATLGLAVAFLFFESSPARADDVELPLDLDWRAPPECPSGDAIRSELARIARVRPGRVPPRIVARSRIDKEGTRYRLILRTEQEKQAGERTLWAGDCATLGRHVTLILALAFGEGVEIVEEAEQPPGAPATATEPTAPAPDSLAIRAGPPVAEPTATTAEALRLAFVLGGGLLAGALPATAWVGVAGVELGVRRFWIAPRVSWLPRAKDAITGQLDARYEGLGGEVVACAAAPFASWLGVACVGAGATALWGRSSGATESSLAVAPWYTANASLSVGWPRDSVVSARLEANLRVSFEEPRFVVVGFGEVHRVSRLAPGLALIVVLGTKPRQSQGTGIVARTKSSM